MVTENPYSLLEQKVELTGRRAHSASFGKQLLQR